MTSAFATSSSGNTAFDFEHEFNQGSAEIDLISSLNPTLVNNVFHSSGDNSEDSIASSHDSPSSYVSGSSEEHGSAIEDFDLYDFGTSYDYNTSSEPFKFSGTQTNSTDVVVDSFLKDFTHPEKTSNIIHPAATTTTTVPMKDSANVTLKNAAFMAAMKQQQQQHQQQMIPPQFAAHQMTPQQLQEQYILMQQQQQRAQLVAAQQYAAAYGAQLSPFSNPFMAAAYHQTPLSGFIHPSPTPTTVGMTQPAITPTSDKPSSPKQEQRSPSPPSSTKQNSKKKTTTPTASSPTTAATSTSPSTGTKRPRETSKSPTSDALAELEAKKPASAEEDKEIKRQRRLIKNRESAQASRERKKMYVKGLETSVEELTNKNTTLTSKIQALEEENRRLRERLTLLDPSGLHLQDALEPDAKKRKLHKLPLPGKPVSTYNPFDVNFWTSFMGGYGSAPQPSIQQQQQQPQIPIVQHEQSTLAAWANPATLGSKRVVMFIMLFCVAVMVMLPKEITQNTLGGPSQAQVAESPLTKPVSTSPLKKKIGARRLMNAEEDTLTHRIKMIYDEFGKTMQADNGTNTLSTTTHIKSEVTSDPLSFTVELNKEKKSLVVSFPLDHLEEEATPSPTTKSSGVSTTTTTKIKEEPVDEDVDMKESSNSSTSNDEKQQATTAESLSLELLREICHVVNS